MTHPLEIRLLGPFEALVGGRAVEVTGPKRHALLALLALHGGRMVPVEPGPGLQRLQAAILAHDPALASVPVAVAVAVAPRGRLPTPVTSLVGREHALAEVAGLVGRHRLVTLIGPPGVGKSRLALAAPLAVPAAGADGAEPAASESVRLFLERARAARPGLPPTHDSLALAAAICRRLDGLPLAIELAAARVSVLGLREILAALERRTPLFVDARDRRAAPQRYLRTVVAWSHDLLHADEKALLHQLAVFRGGAPLPAVVATAAGGQLDAARVTQLLGALVDKSIVSASFPDGGARYDLLDTVREYAVEQLAQAGSLGAAQLAHAEYFATVADAARVELRGRDWLACTRRLELEHDNLWAALSYARDAPDPAIVVRLGVGLGWYFALAERVSEGRSFLEAALAGASADVPVGKRVELLGWLCYLATEELDLDAALEAGQRALAVAATGPAWSESTLARVTLSLALALSGDHEAAAALAEEGRAGYGAAGDDWGVAASSLVRAQGAVHAEEVSTVATMTAEILRHSEAIGYDAFAVPAMLLEAWVAERRNERAAAEDAYRRALELAGRIGFADHAAFALARLGSNALVSGDLRHAEELCRRALATAEAASTSWLAAHARVQLARVLAAAGDADTAETLYGSVVEWSQTPRPRQVRESLFVVLAGSPEAAALRGLARLAAARGDDAVADHLHTRAAAIAERDHASHDTPRGTAAAT